MSCFYMGPPAICRARGEDYNNSSKLATVQLTVF